MKKLTFIFGMFLFMVSCTSVQKLAERGDYNGAVLLAINKLQGKKNKKTKHVRGLEEAFAKINERDLRNAKRLVDQNRASNWEEIFDIYSDIDDRQNAIDPLLPLVSKDGYRAKFTFVRIDNLLNEAAENAAAYEYNQGLKFLERGKKGDKDAARLANSHFLATRRYFNNYKNANDLAKEAIYFGKTRVLVDVKNKANVIIPAAFEREVLDIHVRDLNTKWTEYYVSNNGQHTFDVHAVLEIRNMEISPEREIVHHYTDTRKVKDGFDYALDQNGNVQKDTSGNDIKVIRYKEIRAHVTEIVRTKAALVSGNVYYYDMATGEKFRSQPVNVEATFEDIACRYTGDKRALKQQRLKYIKSYPAPFPSDFALTMDAAVSLKDVLKNEIDNAIF